MWNVSVLWFGESFAGCCRTSLKSTLGGKVAVLGICVCVYIVIWYIERNREHFISVFEPASSQADFVACEEILPKPKVSVSVLSNIEFIYCAPETANSKTALIIAEAASSDCFQWGLPCAWAPCAQTCSWGWGWLEPTLSPHPFLFPWCGQPDPCFSSSHWRRRLHVVFWVDCDSCAASAVLQESVK